MFGRILKRRKTSPNRDGVKEALELLFPAFCCSGADRDTPFLLEHVAAELGSEPRQILSQLAAILGLHCAWTVKAPTSRFIRKTGLSAAVLESRLVLPQESFLSPAGYALVVADPATIEREQWEQAGVQVVLGLASEIRMCWQEYREKEEKKRVPQLHEALSQVIAIAKEKARLGARELFIGCPDHLHYECIINGQVQSGKLAAGLYELLVQQLSAVERIDYAVASPTLSTISLSRVSGFGPIYATWQEKGLEHGAKLSLDRAGKVLVVDDDEFTILCLAYQLEQHGYQVIPSADAQAACRKAVDEGIELIIAGQKQLTEAFLTEANKNKLSILCLADSSGQSLTGSLFPAVISRESTLKELLTSCKAVKIENERH